MDETVVISVEQLDDLIGILKSQGYEVWGAQERDGALGLGPIAAASDLPRGRIEAAEAGTVRLADGPRDAVFDHTLPMQSLKRLVYPAEERLYTTGPDLRVSENVRERFGTKEVHMNGRSPGYGSYWGKSLDNGLTVIVLGNIYNGQPTTIGRDLIAMVLGEPYDPPSFSAVAPGAARTWS